MKKCFTLLILAIIAIVPCSVASTEPTTFKVGLFQLEPLNFLDEKGEPAGFNIDLLKEVFKDAPRKPVFVTGSWNECYERLQKHEIDLMTTVALSPERAEIMDFNKEPVIHIWSQVFQRPETNLNNILDLNQQTVAIMQKDINGQNFISTLRGFGGSCKIIELPSHEDVLLAVASGRAIAGVAPHIFGLRHCREHGLTATSIQFSPFSVFFATKKGENNDLLENIDHYLKIWKSQSDSFYNERLNFWLGTGKSGKTVIPASLLALLAILLLITGLTLYVNRFLKNLIKQKTAELREQEEDFKNLVDCANSLIIRLDADKRISFINQFGQKLLQFTAAQLIGKSVYETILPQAQSDGTEMKNIIEPIFIDPGKHTTFENENLCGDGSRIFVRWSNRAFFDETGKFREMLCIGNDITQQKKLEQELLQTQKMEAVGRLAGGIAHDFNNLLFIIIGNIEIAETHINNPAELANHLANIGIAADRAKELVKQILAFSRKNISEKKQICLADEVKDAIKMLRPTLPSTIQIIEKFTTSRKVLADSNQMNQVLMNLCTNSMHALNGEPGTITIEVANSSLPTDFASTDSRSANASDFVRLSISDTGQGIPKENLSRVFEPFFTTKEKFKGSGMGLAVVHGIIKEHGGEIRVLSEHGKGATFEIYLPATYENTDIEKKEEASSEYLKGAESIMLVDDEPAILKVTAQLLASYGYQVRTFAKAIEALAAFEKNPTAFDLVVTDMTMPELTGVNLARKLLQIKPGIPIVMVTGHSDQIDKAKAIEAGITGFALKPLSVKELLREIRRALEKNNRIQ